MNEANETLKVEICQLFEEHDILYQELDIVTQNLGERLNNMVATMLAHTAKEKYGNPLRVKTLGEAYRRASSSN